MFSLLSQQSHSAYTTGLLTCELNGINSRFCDRSCGFNLNFSYRGFLFYSRCIFTLSKFRAQVSSSRQSTETKCSFTGYVNRFTKAALLRPST